MKESAPREISQQEVEQSIERGLQFLTERQQPIGEFVSLMADDADLLSNAVPHTSPFATTQIISSLLEVPAVKAKKLVEKAVDFIAGDELPGGLWKFWAKSHPSHPNIPPDIDDTACIRHLLERVGRGRWTNRSMLFANRNGQGLFYTWILP